MDWLYVSSIITALHSRHDAFATVPPFLEVEALAFKLNFFREKKFNKQRVKQQVGVASVFTPTTVWTYEADTTASYAGTLVWSGW